MHEAGAVTRAIAPWLDSLGDVPLPQSIRVVIRDLLRAHPDAVRLYATEFLRDRGVEQPIVTVVVDSVPCPSCGSIERPGPLAPVCSACGMSFRTLDGPAVVVEQALVGRGVGIGDGWDQVGERTWITRLAILSRVLAA